MRSLTQTGPVTARQLCRDIYAQTLRYRNSILRRRWEHRMALCRKRIRASTAALAACRKKAATPEGEVSRRLVPRSESNQHLMITNQLHDLHATGAGGPHYS